MAIRELKVCLLGVSEDVFDERKFLQLAAKTLRPQGARLSLKVNFKSNVICLCWSRLKTKFLLIFL